MRHPSFILALVLIAACGGGAEPTTPTPAPIPQPSPTVSRVVVSGDSTSLVPAQTWQLSAQAFDASGVAVAGRTISWSSSAPAVATVSSDGRVSGVTPGRATVVATSDGKADTAIVTVLDGAVIGTAGGSAAVAGGAARVTIPAGVLTADRAISIAPIATPVADSRLVSGTAHEFGPSGAFAAPVTLALRYDAARVPAGMSQTALRVHRLTNGAWVEVPGSTVDTVTRTVSAPTGSFSAYAVLVRVLALETTISITKAGSTCSQPGQCGISGSFIWTVPADVYQATFDLYGASGGGSQGAGTGGRGGRTTATIAVYPGERLQIRLGSAGNRVSAFNGGGRGGDGGPLYDGTGEILLRDGRAGGGATDVLRRGAPLELNAPGLSGRILVAGAGGGDGGPSLRLVDAAKYLFTIDDPGARGGDGGFVGGDGASSRAVVINGEAFSPATGGGGGGVSAYGIGGASSRSGNGRTLTPGTPGTLLNGGGPGGTMTDPVQFTFSNLKGAGGGGGGGGWFAGGGGGPSWEFEQTGGGGGGGSSYGPSDATFVTGVNVGDGKATITFAPSPGRTPTVVTTTVSPAAPTSQQQVTVSAALTLAPPLTGPAAGTLRLVVDNQPVPGATLQVDAAGRVTFSPLLLTAGNHTIAVVFDGTSALGASAGTVDLSVRP